MFTLISLKAIISGWGTLSSGGSQPNALQKADVTIQAKSVGNNAYGQNIGENAFPASASGIDSCQVSFCHFVYLVGLGFIQTFTTG